MTLEPLYEALGQLPTPTSYPTPHFQFIESVQTVLETYGGPVEDWKDTFALEKGAEWRAHQARNPQLYYRIVTI